MCITCFSLFFYVCAFCSILACLFCCGGSYLLVYFLKGQREKEIMLDGYKGREEMKERKPWSGYRVWKKFKKKALRLKIKTKKVGCDWNVLHILFLIKHRDMATILLNTEHNFNLMGHSSHVWKTTVFGKYSVSTLSINYDCKIPTN